MPTVDVEALSRHCAGLLTDAGLPLAPALEAVELLLDADLRGLGSHGVAMLPSYLDGLRGGGVSRRTAAEVVADAGALVILDAGHALGQLTSRQATALAADRARSGGIGAVAVRHGHHFGAASTWSLRLAEVGMVGIALSNSAPLMAAPGGSRPVIGNNPLSIAVIDDDGLPMVADLAMSVGSLGRIRAAQQAGTAIPPGWAVDRFGQPTQDPAEALGGALLPVGGPKGFALALLIEVLTGVLTGGPFGAEVVKFSVHPNRPNDCAHLFLAIDPRAVGMGDAVRAGVRQLAAQISGDPSAGGVRVPGRRRAELAAEARRSGVEVPRPVLDRLEWPL